jgi:hypothetical protein
MVTLRAACHTAAFNLNRVIPRHRRTARGTWAGVDREHRYAQLFFHVCWLTAAIADGAVAATPVTVPTVAASGTHSRSATIGFAFLFAVLDCFV